MDEQPQTPPTVPDQPVAAPPQEQAPTEAQQGTGSDASLQRAYTQTSQKLSAIAGALGIPKTSTTEQFVAAISARRQALAQADAELESDPRLAARAAELRAREERFVRQQYGTSADLALTLRDAAASGISLVDLVSLVDEHLADRASSRSSAATAPAATPAAAPQASASQPPERGLMAEPPRSSGMVDPGVTPDRDKGPEGFFKDLAQRFPILSR